MTARGQEYNRYTHKYDLGEGRVGLNIFETQILEQHQRLWMQNLKKVTVERENR
jgi:hypothetical protein